MTGVGSQRSALDRLARDYGLKHEIVGVSEIDKYAIASYQAIHGETHNFGDITKIDQLPYADLWTYSFPCTDISLAGKQQGLQHANKRNNGLLGLLDLEYDNQPIKATRSGLLYEVERLLIKAVESNTQPKFLLLENVKALVSQKFEDDFYGWLDELSQLGYNNYWKVLNAKDYGIPQNRERVFVVSIHKSVDNGQFRFPQRFPLTKRLKDLLEQQVDEKYYITQEKLAAISGWKAQQDPIENMEKMDKTGVASTLTARGAGEEHSGMILIKEATKQGYALAQDGDGVYLDRPYQKRGVVQKGMIQTLKTSGDDVGVVVGDHQKMKVRKLSPRECYRLMNFTDEQFDRASSVCSNSQLYRQAGNSIVVAVLEHIFTELFIRSGIQWE